VSSICLSIFLDFDLRRRFTLCLHRLLHCVHVVVVKMPDSVRSMVRGIATIAEVPRNSFRLASDSSRCACDSLPIPPARILGVPFGLWLLSSGSPVTADQRIGSCNASHAEVIPHHYRWNVAFRSAAGMILPFAFAQSFCHILAVQPGCRQRRIAGESRTIRTLLSSVWLLQPCPRLS
jgi:hypothetical protein